MWGGSVFDSQKGDTREEVMCNVIRIYLYREFLSDNVLFFFREFGLSIRTL